MHFIIGFAMVALQVKAQGLTNLTIIQVHIK
jgi:hypothetical protein